MTGIIGQKKLVSIFSEYTFTSMPATILLLGPSGAGKHYMAECLAKKFDVELVEVNKQTEAMELVEYLQCPITKIYYIDLSQISDKLQNKFLKFIEEPSNNMRVILGAESEVGILPTVLNRCLKLTLEPYTQEELCTFTWVPKNASPLVYQFCNTPGQLLALGEVSNFDRIKTLCQTIIDQFPKISTPSYANAMSTVCQISCKENDVNKLDFNLFLDLFAYVSFEHYKQYKDNFSFNAYMFTIQQKQRILNKSINKEAFMLQFLNKLWGLSSI